MRVCFPFIGDDIGGSHISALKLIENLDTAAIEPVIVLHQTNGRLAAFLQDKGHHFLAAPDVILPELSGVNNGLDVARAGIGYVTDTLPKLRKFLKSERIDILHTNDGRIHALWSAAALGGPTRHVWHHRGDPQARGINILAPLFADHIVTVSRFARPQRPVRNIDGRWSVIHSPFEHPPEQIDKPAARQLLIDELGCGENTRFLGYFGLLLDRKRPAAMADIVYEYKRRFPGDPVHAVVFGRPVEGVGRIEESAVRMRAEKLGVADRVHLMGFRDPVQPWMRAVDLHLVPAINEPFGRTLIEAMLLGTPVIATRHGGNPEAIEDGLNGCLVEPENPAAFVDPIHRLLKNETEYRRIGETGRSMALEKYGISRHVQSITAIYRELMVNGSNLSQHQE